MLQERGDLWGTNADARCVTTNNTIKKNGLLVMGAGVASQALRRYPGLDRRIADINKLFGNQPFYFEDIGIMTFPTKNHWRDNSPLELVIESAKRAAILADIFKLKRVVLPRPGCGCGGLSWYDVEPAISEILDDRFVIINR